MAKPRSTRQGEGDASPAEPDPSAFSGADLQDIYRALFQSAYDALYVMDALRDRFLMVNDAFLRLTGYDREELLESDLRSLDLIVPDQRSEVEHKRTQMGAVPAEAYAVRIVTKSGAIRDVELSVRRTVLGDRLIVLGSARDVTERAAAAERAGRSLGFQTTLLELARMPNDDRGAAVRRIISLSAAVLGVERAGVWLLTPDRRELVCEALLLRGTGAVESGARLATDACPRFLEAISSERTIAADDALRDPRMSELVPGYLAPLGIASALDVGVSLRGRLAGILCHERTGPTRSWTQEEQAFASSVADRISLLLEAQDLRATQETLRESERKMATLLANLPGYAYRCRNDRDWTLDFISEGVAAVTGYPAADFLATPPRITCAEKIHPDDRARVWDQVKAALDEGRSFELQYRITTASGEERWVREQGQGIRNAAGETDAIEGFVTDITDLKRAEATWRESEERLRLLVGQMPAILWTTDAELRWATSMGAGLAGLGQTPSQHAGVSLYDYFKTRDPEFLPIAMHLRALRGETVTYDFESEGRHWHCLIRPLAGADGRITGCMGFALDLTDRLRMEQQLKESEERFRQLADATTEGIVVHADGAILYTNQNLGTLYGYAPAELVGRKVIDLVAPESRELVARQIASGFDRPYEAVQQRKDGSTFHCEVRGKSIPFQGRMVRVAAIRDMTQIRQMGASLERQVRLEKKKTLEAFQANVRIFQLTEKIRAAYESTSHLVTSKNVQDLLASAVRLLCDPAGLDYREAAIYLARNGGLELAAGCPERTAERISCAADHPAAAAFRDEPGRQSPAGGLLLPLKAPTETVGVLEVQLHNSEEARSWQENILRTLANSLSLMISNLNLYEVVRRQSITDSLTGVHNRRHFDEKLAVEVERAVRYKRSMALVLLDLDDFKRINDTLGHPQGDAVLAEVGALLRRQSRQIDIVSRYGGEEFGLILPETELSNAVRHAERLRESIASRPFTNLREPSQPLRVTASLGVAEVGARLLSPDTVLAAADRACYAAKRAGKNQVRSANGGESPKETA